MLDWQSNLRHAEVGEVLAHPLVEARARFLSRLAPGGTKITIPCRARVSNTREAFFRYCRRSGFFTSVRFAAFIDLLPAVRQSPGHTMRCTYDEPADVVYVAFKPEAEATGSELGPDDIVVRYRGDEVIGLTILHASRRIRGAST